MTRKYNITVKAPQRTSYSGNNQYNKRNSNIISQLINWYILEVLNTSYGCVYEKYSTQGVSRDKYITRLCLVLYFPYTHIQGCFNSNIKCVKGFTNSDTESYLYTTFAYTIIVKVLSCICNQRSVHIQSLYLP